MWSDFPCKIHPNKPEKNGYVRLCRVINGGVPKHFFAHRVALEEKLGRPIQEGYEAGHCCDVPNCVEPEHLEEATHGQNLRQAYRRGRKGRHNWRNPRAPKEVDRD